MSPEIAVVSILTRPERRMQRVDRAHVCAGQNVSILTRPVRRMQRLPNSATTYQVQVFQSSPAPRGGCNVYLLYLLRQGQSRFNPHPPREADATGSSLPIS